jgi:hypothetical protein
LKDNNICTHYDDANYDYVHLAAEYLSNLENMLEKYNIDSYDSFRQKWTASRLAIAVEDLFTTVDPIRSRRNPVVIKPVAGKTGDYFITCEMDLDIDIRTFMSIVYAKFVIEDPKAGKNWNVDNNVKRWNELQWIVKKGAGINKDLQDQFRQVIIGDLRTVIRKGLKNDKMEKVLNKIRSDLNRTNGMIKIRILAIIGTNDVNIKDRFIQD